MVLFKAARANRSQQERAAVEATLGVLEKQIDRQRAFPQSAGAWARSAPARMSPRDATDGVVLKAPWNVEGSHDRTG
jgi:hypothetical protein